MSAVLMRRAADRLQERAEAARGDRPAWKTHVDEYGDRDVWASRDEWDYYPQVVLSDHLLRKTPGVFDHFAALTPDVAVDLAKALRVGATVHDLLSANGVLGDPGEDPLLVALTELARTYLGEGS